MNANNLMLEIQQKVLSATFSHNMATLKKEMPAIYQYYENYVPKSVHLVFDEMGQVNLSANGKFVYQGNPLVESNQQVAKFINEPVHTIYDVKQGGKFISEHERVLENIAKRKENDIGDSRQYILANNQQIDFIAIMGSGLGYHLESLFQKFAIRSALIYEPEPDCFYATLHTIDIKKLIDSCKIHGGELTFKIGGNSNGFINEISSMLSRIGYFNIAKMHLYRHYLSEKNDGAFKMVHELGYRFVQGWGFAEDEIVGMTHTLSNYKYNKYPTILATAKYKKRQQPVFIVGNGPSLDYSFELLKANQNNAIIVSCGTSLKPLLDNGIIPDIHIEQERPVAMYTWIQRAGHQEKLKNIDLICLNNVYPEILGAFKNAHIALKPKDLGATFIQSYLAKQYAEIMYCNPTVTNAATAVMTAMGFKSLYLFGIDYGFKLEDHHHSKDSLYYKDNKGLDKVKTQADFKVPGNFGGDVFTTQAFDQSRMSLELLLQANLDVLCVNTSDGAKVALSTTCSIDDLPNFKPLKDKIHIIKGFLKDSFENQDYQNVDFSKQFLLLLPTFTHYINALIATTENVTSRIELANAFAKQFKFVDADEESVKLLFKRFISGTLNYMQAYIMSNAYSYADIEKQDHYIKYCIIKMNEHLAWLLSDLFEHYNKDARY
tara:strand:+ start:13688 stop:15670 length:1983 start_codon:yes stop_codon:yes gene_type:complete